MPPSSRAALERRVDIDWLRIAATYLLFVFHTGMIFNPAPFFHVRNPETSLAFLVICGFIGLWHMPLFFLLAGWSTRASLAVRGTRGYLAERVLRLVVPLLAGIVLFGPIMKYLELRSGLDLSHTGLRVSADLQDSFRAVIPSGLGIAPEFHETFFEFLPSFFAGLERFTWGHLWFLAYLFTFSVLYLPVITRIAAGGPRLRSPRPLCVYLPLVPLVLIQLTLRERWPGVQNLYDDWANFTYYSVYLLAGVVLASEPELEAIAHREWKRALLLGMAAALVLLGAVLGAFRAPWLLLAGSAVAGWCFVIAILGLGRRFLTSVGWMFDSLRESALPVYILHQVAIIVVGYLVVQLPLGIGVQFFVILGASVALTLAVYHGVVRRLGSLSVLFGVKSGPRRTAQSPLTPAHAAALLAASGMVALLARLAAAATASGEPGGLVGNWFAEGGAAKVAIHRCSEALCGEIVWLRSPWDDRGCEMRDHQNPDPSLRGRTLVGLQILTGLVPEGESGNHWTGGRIYDPGSGRTYQCEARLGAEGRLELRGYFGIPLLGRTTWWLREGEESRVCRASATGENGAQP